MAMVFLAVEEYSFGDGEFIALKALHPRAADEQELLRMFEIEAQVLGSLAHPNVVRLLDSGVVRGTHYLAMEYVAGGSLFELCQRLRAAGGVFPPLAAVELAVQVARGLSCAHAHRSENAAQPVIHRDVSPHNILLAAGGVVKLADFGVAKLTGTETVGGFLKGKYAYMAPEQVAGGIVDARTDIFALGVVMWELLVGARLFLGDSESATLRAVRLRQIPPPDHLAPGIPRALSDTVMRALARNPEERFQNAHAFERALHHIEFLPCGPGCSLAELVEKFGTPKITHAGAALQPQKRLRRLKLLARSLLGQVSE